MGAAGTASSAAGRRAGAARAARGRACGGCARRQAGPRCLREESKVRGGDAASLVPKYRDGLRLDGGRPRDDDDEPAGALSRPSGLDLGLPTHSPA